MLAILCIVSFIMLWFINFFATKAIEYDIKTDMSREIRKNRKFLDIKDETVTAREQFMFEDENMFFQVIDNKGNILLGEYPDNIAIDLKPVSVELRYFKAKGKKYLVLDNLTLGENRNTQERTYVRCVVRENEITSQYETIRYGSYISIPIMMLLVIFSRMLITRQLVNPLREMRETAESIGRQEKITERVEYTGNIIELESMVKANNRMLDRLENMLDTQKQFTSDVAHELRTPVAVIMAQCEYLRGGTPDIADYKEAIEVIYRQEEKAKNIIFQLLNLSHLDQDRTPLELEYVDLNEIIQSICEEEQMKSEEQIAFKIDGSNIFATVDISLMTLAMQNLIGNAVKYSSPPIAVEIHLERQKTLCEGKAIDEVAVIITDHGCGMEQEQCRKIFNRFYRAEQARNSEGFGLGLALVNKIAEVHGGSVEVESEIGKGSTFTFRLPEYQSNQENRKE